MTTQELEKKVTIGRIVSYGRHLIEIIYRGKIYKSTTTNTLAIDCIYSDEEKNFYYTYKQALQSLYNECKEKNNLK